MKSQVFYCFLFLTFLLSLRVFPSLCLAKASANVPKPKAEVNHIAQGFEKVWEKIILFSKFSKKSKLTYWEHLVEKRLAEVKYVLVSNQINSLEPTTSRYSTYLGRLSEFALKHKIVDKKDELLKIYSEHQQILADLQKDFEFNCGWWIMLENDINVNKIFTEKVQAL